MGHGSRCQQQLESMRWQGVVVKRQSAMAYHCKQTAAAYLPCGPFQRPLAAFGAFILEVTLLDRSPKAAMPEGGDYLRRHIRLGTCTMLLQISLLALLCPFNIGTLTIKKAASAFTLPTLVIRERLGLYAAIGIWPHQCHAPAGPGYPCMYAPTRLRFRQNC